MCGYCEQFRNFDLSTLFISEINFYLSHILLVILLLISYFFYFICTPTLVFICNQDAAMGIISALDYFTTLSQSQLYPSHEASWCTWELHCGDTVTTFTILYKRWRCAATTVINLVGRSWWFCASLKTSRTHHET